jgi:peptidoglycan-N-acetylglucosamine deacetylase
VDRRTLLKRLGLGGAGALGASLPVGTYFAGLHNGEHRLHGDYTASVSAGERQGQVRLWWSVDAGRAAEPTKMVALTFDDGPTRQFTSRVLNILGDHNVPASFFLIGELVRRHPDLVRRILEEGHDAGNHTFDHLSAGTQSPDEVRRTVERGANAIASISGERPRWFRPVRGHVTGALMQAVADAGHEMAMWSVSRGDTAADDDVDAVRENYISTIHDGAIVIFHDGIGRSAWELTGPDDQLVTQRTAEIEALPAVIDRYLADGYELVTISSLIDRSLESPAGQI